MKLRQRMTQPGIVGIDFIKGGIESTTGISTCAVSKDKPAQSHCRMLTARIYFPAKLDWAEQHWSEALGPLPCIPLASLKWIPIEFKFLLFYCGEHPSHQEVASPIHPQPCLNSGKGKYIPDRYIHAFSTKKARKDSHKWKTNNIPNSLIFFFFLEKCYLLNILKFELQLKHAKAFAFIDSVIDLDTSSCFLFSSVLVLRKKHTPQHFSFTCPN